MVSMKFVLLFAAAVMQANATPIFNGLFGATNDMMKNIMGMPTDVMNHMKARDYSKAMSTLVQTPMNSGMQLATEAMKMPMNIAGQFTGKDGMFGSLMANNPLEGLMKDSPLSGLQGQGKDLMASLNGIVEKGTSQVSDMVNKMKEMNLDASQITSQLEKLGLSGDEIKKALDVSKVTDGLKEAQSKVEGLTKDITKNVEDVKSKAEGVSKDITKKVEDVKSKAEGLAKEEPKA